MLGQAARVCLRVPHRAWVYVRIPLLAVLGPTNVTMSLFAAEARQSLGAGAWLLRGCAAAQAAELFADIAAVIAVAPLRHMITAGGQRMSVAMTNCGALGWVSDRSGYRYVACDPVSGRPWPPLPAAFLRLARTAALDAGFDHFVPDVGLINCYHPGTRLSLHQDKDERDFSQPIVSVSFGIPAVFLFGGSRRRDPTVRVGLTHGDVVVWGGPARLYYHGVSELAADRHPVVGPCRFNLTLRKAA